MRDLDHIVWPTRDLARLAETFRRLGFTVGRRNRHPWGTENHIVQFDGCFLELLGFAEDYRPLPPNDPAVPFAGFCEAFLAESDGGAAMIVLRSDDAAADAARFRADGLGEGRLLPFSRAAQGPNGADRTVAFTVAFATLPGLRGLGAFTCQQHRPENFWSAEAQRHANRAAGIGAVLVEAVDPREATASLRSFVGPSADDPDPDVAPCGRSVIRVVDLPEPGADVGVGARIAAVHVSIPEWAPLAVALDSVGIPYRTEHADIRIDARVCGGTDLVFSPVAPRRR